MPKIQGVKEVEVKSRAAKKTTERTCLRCGKMLPIENFRVNRDWTDRGGHDVWCKECFGRIATKDGIREYYWENHRKWNDQLWTNAEAKADKALSNNETYNSLPDDRKESVRERTICQYLGKIVNSAAEGQYEYYDSTEGGKYLSYSDWKAKNGTKEEIKDAISDAKCYSKEFNGYFKRSELEYLENYYAKLEDDFSFDTENRRDYARKVCKASLQADKAQDDYMAGRCDYSVVKDAMALFDMLSKSANFAACKRQPGESGGAGSWNELTLILETTGHAATRKIEWPKDDVDRTIDEYRHTVQAINIE